MDLNTRMQSQTKEFFHLEAENPLQVDSLKMWISAVKKVAILVQATTLLLVLILLKSNCQDHNQTSI
jgi:hypothetical protein